MSLILPYLYFISIFICLKIVFNKNLWLLIPSSIILLSVVVIFAGYIGDLRVGIFAPVLLVPIAIYIIIKQGGVILKQLLSIDTIAPLLVFSIVVLYAAIYYKYSGFYYYDDFQHWGPMVKGMLQYNKLYCDLKINAAHLEYPPLVQSFEYIWSYLSGGFAEKTIMRSLFIFTSTIMFPVIYKTKQSYTKILVFIAIILIVPMIDYLELYSYSLSIYIDLTIATTVAITLFLAIEIDYKHTFECVVLSIYLIGILLIKEIGIAFYLMSLFMICFNSSMKRKDFIRYLVLFVVIPIVIIISWKVKTANIIGQFDINKINIKEVLDIILFNKGTQAQLAVKNNFISSLFSKNLLLFSGTSYFICTAVSAFILIVITLLLYKHNIKRIVIVNIAYILGVFGYALTMMVLYLTCFTSQEASYLASFERYMGTYIHMSILLIIALIYQFKNNIVPIATLLLLLMISQHNIKNYSMLDYKSREKKIDSKVQTMFDQIDSINPSQRKRILIVHLANREAWQEAGLRYLDCEIGSLQLMRDDNGGVFKDHVFKDANELINSYKDKYDYVYLYTTNEELYKVWIQTDNDDLLNDRLYVVHNGTLKIVPWSNDN